MRAVVLAEAEGLGLPSVLATDGAYGHVKAGNTGVCADMAGPMSCDPSDPRGAWSRSMADMALMGFADVEVMLFQSKFGAAANMRASIPLGLREFYRDARLTHSLVAPLADEMAGRAERRTARTRRAPTRGRGSGTCSGPRERGKGSGPADTRWGAPVAMGARERASDRVYDASRGSAERA